MAQDTDRKKYLKLSNAESNRITRESLAIALLKLMKKKSFKDITVTELVGCAGVSRTAFYRNYTSKEDILREVSYETAETVKKTLSSEQYKHNFRAWLTEYFGVVRKNADIIEILLKTNYPNTTLYDWFDFNIPVLEESPIAERYRFIYISSGLNSIIFHWIKTGLRESEEEMADICMDIMGAERK